MKRPVINKTVIIKAVEHFKKQLGSDVGAIESALHARTIFEAMFIIEVAIGNYIDWEIFTK